MYLNGGVIGNVEATPIPDYTFTLIGSGNVIFRDNKVSFAGGALFVRPALDWTNFTGSILFENNESGGGGGAIAVSYSPATLGSNIVFRGNKAGGNIGGAISAGYPVTLGNNVVFEKNEASNRGGAIGISLAALTLNRNTLFLQNQAGNDGGAIYAQRDINIEGNTLFEGNMAGNRGGAIYLAEPEPHVIKLNAADGDIVFRGNRSGVTNFTNPNSGTPDSIHMVRQAHLLLQGNRNIYFDDPISGTEVSVNSRENSLTVDMTGTGFVQFLGNNRLKTAQVASANSVEITGGTFRLAHLAGTPAHFNASGDGVFYVGTNGTIAGNGTITAESFTISGTVSPDGWLFVSPEWDSDTLSFKNGTPPTGSAIGTLTLVGDVEFDGATITIDTVGTTNDKVVITGDASIVAGSSLSIGVGPTPSLDVSGTFDFGTTGHLNISGYTPEEAGDEYSNGGDHHVRTIITTNGGVFNFNPDVTVAGQATDDFLSASASVVGNNVEVSTRLRWYSTRSYSIGARYF